MYKALLYIWFFINILMSQTIIGPGLTKQQLFNFLSENYTTSSTLGYNQARDIMYSIIDIQENNSLKGIYTDYTITLDPTQDPSTNAFEQNINCEHSWPQSMGAGSEPQKSDLHHLYPCRSNVNSSRGNKPYGEINDQDTDKWFRFDYDQTSIPTQNIEEYSEVDYDNDEFEPKENVKGNIARGMFYFFTIYNSAADHNFFESQKDILYQWHNLDPVDNTEINRTNSIAIYQNNIPNPFVIDSTLIRRIWYLNCFEEITSSQIINFLSEYIDYNTNFDVNSDNKINIIDLIHLLNRENNGQAYFNCN